MSDVRGKTDWFTGDTAKLSRTDHLRNAISKVQRQKQRPTALRICKAVRQCVDSVTTEQIAEWLDAAVRCGDILMVNNDGIISYREPRPNATGGTPASVAKSVVPPPVPDLICRTDPSWFPPRYEQFRDFVLPPSGWSFPQPSYDPYGPFVDRVAESYDSWNGSFMAGMIDPARAYVDDTARQHYGTHSVEPLFYEPSEKYMRLNCDENRNRRDCNFGVSQSSATSTMSKMQDFPPVDVYSRMFAPPTTGFSDRLDYGGCTMPHHGDRSRSSKSSVPHSYHSNMMSTSKNISTSAAKEACFPSRTVGPVSGDFRADTDLPVVRRSAGVTEEICQSAPIVPAMCQVNSSRVAPFSDSPAVSANTNDLKFLSSSYYPAEPFDHREQLTSSSTSARIIPSAVNSCLNDIAISERTLPSKDLQDMPHSTADPVTVCVDTKLTLDARTSPCVERCMKEDLHGLSESSGKLEHLEDTGHGTDASEQDDVGHQQNLQQDSVSLADDADVQVPSATEHRSDVVPCSPVFLRETIDDAHESGLEASLLQPEATSPAAADPLERCQSAASDSGLDEPSEPAVNESETGSSLNVIAGDVDSTMQPAGAPSSNLTEVVQPSPDAESTPSLHRQVPSPQRPEARDSDQASTVPLPAASFDVGSMMFSSSRIGRGGYSCLHPRGLIDGLSRFFTPTDRRGPRVCRELLAPAQSCPSFSIAHPRPVKTEFSDITVATQGVTSMCSMLTETTVLSNSSMATIKSTNRPRSNHRHHHHRSVSKSSDIHRIHRTVPADRSSAVKRPREQLVDGLSHFFTAVGKRRSCVSSRLRTDSEGGSSIRSDTASLRCASPTRGVVSEAESNRVQPEMSSLETSPLRRFRTKLSPGKRIATVRLKRLPISLTRGFSGRNFRCPRFVVDTSAATGRNRCSPSGPAGKSSRVDDLSAYTTTSPTIMHHDLVLFKKSIKIAVERSLVSQGANRDPLRPRPPSIRFGPFELDTSFSSHYPAEFASQPKLFICEFCLKYMKSNQQLQQHVANCDMHHPPGVEIYRQTSAAVSSVDGGVADLSVYEVSGGSEDPPTAVYCTNLCLLVELFHGHHSMPVCATVPLTSFKFYVLIRGNRRTPRPYFVGCFLKDAGRESCTSRVDAAKADPAICLSTLFILPPYQQQGFDYFLVDMSYQLCRLTSCAGLPPPSDTGAVLSSAAVANNVLELHWLRKVSDCLRGCLGSAISPSVEDVARDTGICARDVISTLRQHKLAAIRADSDPCCPLEVDIDALSAATEKIASSVVPMVAVDTDCLVLAASDPVDSSLECEAHSAGNSRNDYNLTLGRTARVKGRVRKSQQLQQPCSGRRGLESRANIFDVLTNNIVNTRPSRAPKRQTLRSKSAALRLKKLQQFAATSSVSSDLNKHLPSVDAQKVDSTFESPSSTVTTGDDGDLKPPVLTCAVISPMDTVDTKPEPLGCKVQPLAENLSDNGIARLRNTEVKVENLDDDIESRAESDKMLDEAVKPAALQQTPTKPSPQRVSVAVQTDAYDSDDDDEDSTSSSGSSDDESSSSSDDESSECDTCVSSPRATDEAKQPSSVAALELEDQHDPEALSPKVNTTVNRESVCENSPPILYKSPSPLTAAENCNEEESANAGLNSADVSMPALTTVGESIAADKPCSSSSSAPVVSRRKSSGFLASDGQQPYSVSVIESPLSVNSGCSVEADRKKSCSTPRQPASDDATTGITSHVLSTDAAPQRFGSESGTRNLPSRCDSVVVPLLQTEVHRSRSTTSEVFEMSTEFVLSDLPTAKDGRMSFKMPGHSPDDGRNYPGPESYHANAGYSSSPSVYGISSSECSPSCTQIPPAGCGQNLLAGGPIVGYSMPTPSPTNSSSRSFNMASPSAYQQSPSVGSGCQMEQGMPGAAGGGYQLEPAGYPTSMPLAAGGYQSMMDSFSPAYHPHVMTPPVEHVISNNRNCPSAPAMGYLPSQRQTQQQQPLYSGVCMTGVVAGAPPSWSQFYSGHPGDVNPVNFLPQQQQQQQQQLGVSTVPMQPQQMQPAAVTAKPPSLRSSSDRHMHRRCGKSCSKNVTSSATMRAPSQSANSAAPNVIIQPGTNMITAYNMYDAASVGPLSGGRIPSASSLHSPLGYPGASQHHPAALSYPGGYIADPRQQMLGPTMSPQMDIYHHQQLAGFGTPPQTAPGGMYPNSYGYMNGTVGTGHQSPFGMNIRRQ